MPRKYQNFYGTLTCGENCTFGEFVDIGTVEFGHDCKIQCHVSIPNGWKIGNNVFIGPGVRFANDKHPRASNAHFEPLEGIVEDNVSIGMGALIGPGVRIGKGAIIGMGAVVIKDVESCTTVVGNPAKPLVK